VSRPHIAEPAVSDHKYSRGLVAVIEGAMPGAARLAARAAMAGGAGYVVLAGTDPAGGGPDALVRRTVTSGEALAEFLAWDRIGAVVLGPGLGREGLAQAWLRAAFAADKPLVVDGDALSLMGSGATAWLRSRTAPTWATPHEGEFARMFGAGEGSKLDRTRAAARASGATVVHKGADTVIADGAGGTVLAGGSPWLSTAGSGDVLAGLIAARVAAGGRGTAPAAAAAWLHARAASAAGPAFTADALVEHLPQAVGACR
jgi:ADP-dependent NAD(P)H-hydrate dehydratase / NAD(P)H-hydrate epimerase